MKQKQALWEKKKKKHNCTSCHCFITIIKQHTWPLTKRKLPFPRNRRRTESDRNHFFFSLFLLQLSDSSKGKEGNPCPLNHGRRLEKEGQLKVSKDESVWNYLCKGGEQGKSQNGLEGFFLAYGKILTIAGNPLLKYYLMSEFQNRFWHSPVCQKHPGCSC